MTIPLDIDVLYWDALRQELIHYDLQLVSKPKVDLNRTTPLFFHKGESRIMVKRQEEVIIVIYCDNTPYNQGFLTEVLALLPTEVIGNLPLQIYKSEDGNWVLLEQSVSVDTPTES